MPLITLPITPDGYLVEVLIGVSGADATQLQGEGNPVPPPIRATAGLDTASNVTCVAATILRQLGVAKTGERHTQTTTGSYPVNLFEVSLSILGVNCLLFTASDLIVMEMAIPLEGIDVVVGRDVLDQCLFISNGPQKQFTLGA